MRAAALLLLLAVPASADNYPTYAQYPYAQFKALIAKATEEVGLLSPPNVRQGEWTGTENWIAWVSPPLPIIWVSPRHLDAPVGELCDTAYHEVVHLWMTQEGLEDAKNHENHAAWMISFSVEERCRGGAGPPEWEGVPYEDFRGD